MTLVQDYDTQLEIMVDTCSGLYYSEVRLEEEWVARYKCQHGFWTTLEDAIQANHKTGL